MLDKVGNDNIDQVYKLFNDSGFDIKDIDFKSDLKIPEALVEKLSALGSAPSLEEANVEFTNQDLKDLAEFLKTLSSGDKNEAVNLKSQNLDDLPYVGFSFSNILTEVAALIVKTNSQQREMNREEILKETKALTVSIKNQADEIREQAKKQMNAAIVSGSLSIASGAVNFTGSIHAGIKSKGLVGDDANSVIKSVMTKYEAGATALKGIGDIASGVLNSQATVSQAEQKDYEAEQAKINAQIEQLKNYNESLKEVTEKLISTTLSVSETERQARNKILG